MLYYLESEYNQSNLLLELHNENLPIHLSSDYMNILYLLCYLRPININNDIYINTNEIIKMLDNIEYYLKFKKISNYIIDYKMCRRNDDNIYSEFNDEYNKIDICFRWLNIMLKHNAKIFIRSS